MRQMTLMIDGVAEGLNAKTGLNLLRYQPEQVVAAIDRARGPATCGERYGLGGDTPVVADLADAPPADTFVLAVAPAGGRIPEAWRPTILEAIGRGMTLLSGMHQFLCDDAEFAAAAAAANARLVDVRRNNARTLVRREGIDPRCLRLHTVGHDCNCGKMVVSLELARALTRAGHDAKFVATGQTGIMIEGDGCPIDCVVADFINGAAEQLVLDHQHHGILIVEGQGSITHPMYSSVTLGLLHGCLPDGLILCYRMGRTHHTNIDVACKPLTRLRDLYTTLGSVHHPCRVIAIGANTMGFSDAEARAECQRVEAELGLPAVDIVRDGPERLIEAVAALKRELGK
ncbi:MAG: DUF1611 domain-containing protein [Planctomycetota bacterium]